MYKIPNYLNELAIDTNRCRLCIDKQDNLIKEVCNNSDIRRLSKKLNVSGRLIYYWLRGERPVPIIKLIELGKLKNRELLFESYKNAKYVSINGVTQKTKLCKYLTPKLSYLIGYIFGDGHIGKYNFSIYDNSKQNIKLVNKLLKEIFNLDVKYKFRKDRNCYEINISWKVGVLFLNKVFNMPVGNKNGKLFMPKLIKNSNLEIQKMFVLGLLAADFGGNSLTQTSYKILQDISKVLNNLKIKNKIYGPYGPYKGNEVKKWVLSFDKISQDKIVYELSKIVNLVKFKKDKI